VNAAARTIKMTMKIMISLLVGVIIGISLSLINWSGGQVKECSDLNQDQSELVQEHTLNSSIAGFWKVENTLIFFDAQSDLSGVANKIHMADDGIVVSPTPWELTDFKAFKGLLDDSLLPMEEIYIDRKRRGESHEIISTQVYKFMSTGELFFHFKNKNRDEIIQFNNLDSDVVIESYTKVLAF
jgi:hypothetical protein